MRRRGNPAQGVLFGFQPVHVGRYTPVPSSRTCVMCRVLLAVSAAWDDCDTCPGYIAPAPPWVLLGALEYLAAEEAA